MFLENVGHELYSSVINSPDTEYGDALYRTEIQWLSRGTFYMDFRIEN